MAEHATQMRIRPTGRGVTATVLGGLLLGLGLRWHYAGVVAFGAGLLLLALLALGSVLIPVRLDPQRRVSPLRVPRQGECTATLRISSTGRRLAVRIDALERIGERLVPIMVPRLMPGRGVETKYQIPTTRRGPVAVGPLRLQRVGVAGLAVARAELGGTVTVHVLPRVLPCRGLPAGVRRGHVGADERVERGGTDLLALREYVAGDDLRRVHWATTARTGQLMIREDADPARPYLTVLLDDRASSYVDDQFEDAVEVAASLVSSALEDGHPVRLGTVSGRVELDVPSAPVGMLAPGADEPMRLLAELRATADDAEPASIPVRDLDVVVAVTGSVADLSPLVSEASRAPLGAACVIDQARWGVDAQGSVLVLRGPRAEDVLRSWDEMVF